MPSHGRAGPIARADAIRAAGSAEGHALLSQFGDLLRQDHEGNANLLRHIDAIDRRQLWAKLGYPSLFAFLVTRHHMSESTAGKRIGAARTARRFPILFSMVARGELHLSGIHRLKAHLTRENHEQLLASAKHKTIRQIEEGRCGFIGEDGHRCNETRGLQFAHVYPWGKGGADTAVNLGLRCIAHNAWEADRDYGLSHMARRRKQKPLKVREPVARYFVRRAPRAVMATVLRSKASAGVSVSRADPTSHGAGNGAPAEHD